MNNLELRMARTDTRETKRIEGRRTECHGEAGPVGGRLTPEAQTNIGRGLL